ncbi:MAG: DNA-3-methyladenine glycosylase [Bryobacteraceae bacterium]
MKAAIRHLTQSDPILAQIIGQVGPFLFSVRKPTFETLARSITFQQLSGKAAKTIFDRVRKATGRRFTPTAFLKLTPEQLRACGLSRQKIASLTDLAERTVRKEIDFRKLPLMTDEEVIGQLSQVRGVGVWTAQMFLIFALERLDVMPTGDLGIRNAVQRAYGLTTVPKPADLLELCEKWRPYCSVASWYLWRSLDGPAAL